MYFIHTKRKMMMKELSKEEIFEINGGVANALKSLAGPSIIREVKPIINDFINKGARDRSEAWEKYCPKCC